MADKGGEHKPVTESLGEKLALAMGGGAVAGMFGMTVLKFNGDAHAAGASTAWVALVWLLASVGVLGMVVLFFSYLSAVKGAAADAGTPQHQHYQALRHSLQHGGSTEARYARWLTRLLDAVALLRLCRPARTSLATALLWAGCGQVRRTAVVSTGL